jgi:hypothetical protein
VNLRNFFAELKRCFQKVLLKGVIGNPRVRKTFAQSEGRIISSSAWSRTIWDDRANAVTQKNALAGGDGKRFVVCAYEKLTAFVEIESAVRACGLLR